MRIGFYLANKDIQNIDLSNPWKGNPGCGGTEYLFSALPCFLAAYKPHLHIVIYAHHTKLLPDNCQGVEVIDLIDAAHKAKDDGCDFLYIDQAEIVRIDFCL